MFWLATDSWTDAPRITRDEEGNTFFSNGTQPPITSSYSLPFKGKTTEQCAEFIKQAPEEYCVDWHHFAVLGEDYKKRRLVTLWRIGDGELKGERLTSLPATVAKSTLFLSGLESRIWDECLEDHKDDDEPVM